MIKSHLLSAAIVAGLASIVHADILTTVSVSITGTGGSGGSGTTASDMVFENYQTSDGWGWAGGAGGVQGTLATTNSGGYSAAANEVFRFSIGATIDSLNATYGAGNWTVTNVTLNFNSSYAKQNNSRFGVGSGTFDIYWVGNDAWAQSKGTESDRGTNPIYASDEATLAAWAGSTSLLGSEEFIIASGATGYVNLNYELGLTEELLNDILAATAASNPDISLYLMATSETLGMIIFTGGQGQSLPTLSFDVVAVPEPASVAILALTGAGLLLRRRK